MQISSRFTVALHIFTCVDTFKDEQREAAQIRIESVNNRKQSQIIISYALTFS